MCLGKSDFEAVSNVREDDFFRQALGLERVPSPETLRQRLDEHAAVLREVIDEADIEFLVNAKAPVCAQDRSCAGGHRCLSHGQLRDQERRSLAHLPRR
jgi:hypothetical protein